MDSCICTYCESKIIEFPFGFEEKPFCSNDCVIKFANKRIKSLTQDIICWKKAWFELREIIGRLGLKYIIEPRFESNKNAATQCVP